MKAASAIVLSVGIICLGGALVSAAFGASPNKRTYTPNALPPAMGSPSLIIRPGRASRGYNCSAQCAISCNRISCAGLDVATCNGERQSCRTTCVSRC